LERIQLPHNIGFQNFGNTCYVNSSLQALLGQSKLVTEMLNVKELLSPDGVPRLLHVFCQLCKACNQGEANVANQVVREVKRMVGSIDKEFAGDEMQDASEFLCRVLDELSENIITLSMDLPADMADEFSVIKSNFLHERNYARFCVECNARSRSKSSNMTFWCDAVSLTRRRALSLQELVEQNLAEELVEKKCDECGCNEAKSTSELSKLPKVMVIVLKRYKYDDKKYTPSAKISNEVDIPDILSFTSLVSESVKLPSSDNTPLEVGSSSTKSSVGFVTSTPYGKVEKNLATHIESPVTFRDEEVVNLEKMNEQEQLDYVLKKSEKDYFEPNEFDDADMKAALEASLKDVHNDNSAEVLERGDHSEVVLKKPRKKLFGGGLYDRDEKLKKALDYLDMKDKCLKLEAKDSGKDRSRKRRGGPGSVVGSKHSKKQKDDSEQGAEYQEPMFSSSGACKSEILDFEVPKTKDQEESDLQQALEMSMKEGEMKDKDDGNNAMEDLENNLAEEVAEPVPGKPEHQYRLHSVVSHHGSSTSSGHYVTDVYRFDARSWYRYDDEKVSRTSALSVRTGSNRVNGYIFTFLYQPLWEENHKLVQQR